MGSEWQHGGLRDGGHLDEGREMWELSRCTLIGQLSSTANRW